MAKKNLNKVIPFIDGGKTSKYGFNLISMIPTDTVPNAAEGNFYYDDSENKLKLCTDGSTWTALAAANTATTGLDGAYDLNRTITVDGGAVTLAANGSIGMTITQATNYVGLYVNNTAGSGNAIDIQNAGTGYDIEGSDNTWRVTKAGAATFTSVTGVGNLSCADITATTSTVSITGDATTGTVATINLDTLTSGVGLLLDMNAASTATLFDILVGAAHVLTVTDTGVLTLAGVAEGTSTLTLTTGDLTLTNGDIVITEGQFTMTGDANADVMTVTGCTTGNNDVLYLNGTTSAGSGSIFKIDQGAGARTGHAIDVNMGATATGMSGIDISCTGGTRTVPIININSDGTASDVLHIENSVIFTGNMLNLVQDTSAATGNFIFINNDSGTSMEAINIDDESNTEDIILIDTAANRAAGKSGIHIISAGTPNATGTALFIDWTGITSTNTPYAAQISTTGKDAGALAITSGAATDSTVTITGSGAIANDKAILELLMTGTPANAGSNMLRVDGSGGTNTVKPVLVEVYDDSVATGLVVNTACTANDVVDIIVAGALADNYAGLNITSTGNLATGGNLARLIVGGTPHAASVALEIDSGVGLGISVTSAALNNIVHIDGTGVTANDKAVLDVSSTGLIAAGASLIRISSTAQPAGATAYGMTINCDATNLEALWVEKGTVLIAETLTVTGVTTCTGGVVSSIGTTANIHDTTPTITELTTAFGAAYATKTGWIGSVIDSSTSKVYLVSSNGTTFTYTLMATASA
jgi:hypothetical protein